MNPIKAHRDRIRAEKEAELRAWFALTGVVCESCRQPLEDHKLFEPTESEATNKRVCANLWPGVIRNSLDRRNNTQRSL